MSDPKKSPANTPAESPVGHIFHALAAVKDEINAEGVSKERENKQQGFHYRGVDDALNAFSGPFARNKILTTPVFTTTHRGEMKTRNSSVNHVVVECVCTFLSLVDGSSITVGPFEGEATDSLDKATTKATSVAIRNLLFFTFTVPFGPEEPEQNETGAELSGKDEAVNSPNGGPAVIELSTSQERLLDKKLLIAGRDREWLLDEFGGVSKANINAALKFVESNHAEEE